MKTWLITGCSSGIGQGIAKAVLKSGDRAVVTARNKEKVMDIVKDYPETSLAVSLDVCDKESIKNRSANPNLQIKKRKCRITQSKLKHH